MVERIPELVQLTPAQIFICAGIVFMAGLVRGFSGFALSALIMAAGVAILPPIELIPVCFFLEGLAGLMMLRGGIRSANMTVVWGLVVGAIIGVPVGLYATTTISPEASKLVALFVIGSLAAAQLWKMSPAFLATRTGLYGSGIVSGIVTGLASVGGLVVALYVLARRSPAVEMRGSLVMYLFITMFTSLIYLIGYEVMTMTALYRGLVLIPPTMIGVLIGTLIFQPSMETIYKRFCLILLIGLAVAGIINQVT